MKFVVTEDAVISVRSLLWFLDVSGTDGRVRGFDGVDVGVEAGDGRFWPIWEPHMMPRVCADFGVPHCDAAVLHLFFK